MATYTQPRQQRGGMIGAIANLGRMLSAGLAGLAEQRAPGWSCSPAGPLGEDLSSRMPAYEPLPTPAATPLVQAKPTNANRAAGQIRHNVAG